MAFQQHWNRFTKLAQRDNLPPSTERIAQMAYSWGREDAAIEQRIEDERRLAGQLNGGPSNEGQSA